jgi:hypothetical protein
MAADDVALVPEGTRHEDPVAKGGEDMAKGKSMQKEKKKPKKSK